MKRILLSGVIILVTSLALVALGPYSTAGEVFRLHVVANSDEDMDQATKILVRNKVFLLMNEINIEDMDEHIPWLQHEVDEYLKELNQDYMSDWQLGYQYFPKTEYGGTSYPEGEYYALKVVLGEGRGQNWWCVLFPNLCLIEGITEEEEPAEILLFLEEDIKISWRLQDLWSDLRKSRFWAMLQ